ncbi:MAG: serine--tRNA ligase [Candidatus Diapherotrites archaeon]|uniref:Serine--tRNA ligase n=1 Tax=Candidatus Iainarchaeum sp. TaxID=3101447 RepID=A0A8T3YL83_9ARCH|nr:serine--tRNA ligase [Candidatus Diapherotrites archaeon]
MLDIRFVRDNPGTVRADLEKRGDAEKLGWLDRLLEADVAYRASLQEAESLRMQRNRITEEINALMAQKKDFKAKIAEAKKLPGKIKEAESKAAPLKEKVDYYLMRLPNVLHESVPVGRDDSENVALREYGKKISNPGMAPHGDILEKNGWADFARATRISGSGFYFLKGQFAMLELSLVRFALDRLVLKGYTPVQPPLMMSRAAYEGVTDLADFESVMYEVGSDGLYLIATSEHPMAAMYRNEIFAESDLPVRFAGVSPCFRREIGKHGIDTRGIFRVHQFNKVEQFIFCRPEDSWGFHEELIANAEGLFRDMGLAYRVVDICTGDIGTVAAKKYDLEVWMPREGKYREAVSCSNCTSYQAVRSNIKFRKKDGEKEYVHTLNSTAVATSRALRAIVETYYADGALKIPGPLQPYMGGVKEITAEK